MNVKFKIKINELNLYTIALGVFLFLLPLDCINLGALGSLLRVVTILPIILLLVQRPIPFIKIHFNKISISLIMLLIVVITNYLFINRFNVDFAYVLSLLFNISFVFIFAATTHYSIKEQSYLFKCYILSGLVLLILYLLYGNFQYQGRLSIFINSDTEMASQDQNYVNGYMLPLYCYCLYLYTKNKNIVNMLYLVILLGIVVLTGSRGALLAYLVSSLCILFYSSKSILRSILMIVACIVVLGLTVVAVNSIEYNGGMSFINRFSYGYIIEKGTTGRFGLWEELIDYMFGDGMFSNLLGLGLRASTFITYTGHVAHNLFLEYFVSYGIVGLFIIINILLNCFNKIRIYNNIVLLSIFLGIITMSMSLSIVNYKPLWMLILITMIIEEQGCDNNKQKDI